MKALLAAGVISDINDPKWHSMSAEEAAKMLADADIDPSKIKDPAVAAAIRLAHRVAAGDVHAARHVAAHAIAGKVVAASLPAKMVTIYVNVAGSVDDFTPSALSTFGVELASSLGLPTSAVSVALHSGSVVLAITLPAPYADKLRALFSSGALKEVAGQPIIGVSTTTPSGHGHLPLGSHKVVLKHAFVKKAKGLLLNALSAVGLMSHPIHSSDWKDVTLRKAANRLDSLNLTPESVDDPVVRKALVLARAIAQDDVVKAQGIVADEKSEHSEAVDTLASRMSSAEAVQSSQTKS